MAFREMLLSQQLPVSLSRVAVRTSLPCCRRSYTKYTIKENDIVLLKKKGDSNAEPLLTQSLKPGTKVPIPNTKGYIPTSALIGRSWRDSVESVSDQKRSKRAVEYRIHEPSLADYVVHSPRIVTPIYPSDANLIVSLLDLHPTTPTDPNPTEKIEIFEAGTGHGSLTLHLARAVHGANTAAPPLPRLKARPATVEAGKSNIDTVTPAKSVEELELEQEIKAEQDVYDAWRALRRAVIHTLDNNPSHSGFAKRTVRNYRRGIYFPHIDFHVGGITEYLSGRLEETNEPFLEHAVLDLPGTHNYLEIVGKALKPNGALITFCPSVTQIMSCVTLVKELKLPFVLESVLELGSSVGTGGREWDLRVMKSRATVKLEAVARDASKESTMEGGDAESVEAVEVRAPETALSDAAGTWELICRPKVGVRTVGGGFVALWRKMECEQV